MTARSRCGICRAGANCTPSLDMRAGARRGSDCGWAAGGLGVGDSTLKVWDLQSGAELHTLSGHAGWVSAVAVTPDGRRAVSASADYTLKVWDLASGRELHTLRGHAHGVNAVAVTADGRRAVSASCDSTLKVWDLPSGRELHTLSGHGGEVPPWR